MGPVVAVWTMVAISFVMLALTIWYGKKLDKDEEAKQKKE